MWRIGGIERRMVIIIPFLLSLSLTHTQFLSDAFASCCEPFPFLHCRSFTMKGVRVLTAESVWRAQVEEAGRLEGAIGRLKEDLGSQLEAEKKKGERVGRVSGF